MAVTSSVPGANAATTNQMATGSGATSGRWRVIGAVGQAPERAGTNGHFELSVRDGIITSLQPAGSGRPRPAVGQARLVLAPLLVNAHDHGRGFGNVLAGIPDAPLETWIASLASQMGTTTQEALVGDGCRVMLRSGVGATVICVNPLGRDTAAEVRAAAKAATEAGARAAVVYPFADAIGEPLGRDRDFVGWSRGELYRHLEAFEAVTAAVQNPLIEMQLGPVGPQWVSEATLATVGAHARRTGRRVHMHLLESPAQRAWADRTYPEGVLNFLGRNDLVGPHVCFAHGTHLRPDEIAVLAAEGCVLAVNASSNLRLASGIPPIADARQSTVHLGVGLDGLALGDDADYWNELRLVRGIAQAQTGQTAPAEAFFERVWRGGHRALGNCAPATIEVGNQADFVLLDVSGYDHLVSREDWTVADVVIAVGRPERVREVWVGGRRAYMPAEAAPNSKGAEVAS